MSPGLIDRGPVKSSYEFDMGFVFSLCWQSQFEDMCRRGEIAYKDRNNKFVIM